jgi:hypothetical protein
VVRFLLPLVLLFCPLIVCGQIPAPAAGEAVREPREAFLSRFREELGKRNVTGLMSLVWLRNADDEARESLERAFQLLVQQHLVEARIVPKGDAEEYDFTVGGRGYGTDLEVVAVLHLTIAFGGPDGPRLQYIYPMGQSDGRLFICPAVRRGR